MTRTACIELEGRHEYPLSVISAVVSLVAIFTSLAATPLHADTIYSGASVGSDGTVYGWGVTDATSMVAHTTHMNSQLSSPSGRGTAAFTSQGDYSRIDLSLPYGANDTGTYIMSSTHWAYCPYGGWFIAGLLTQGSASNAYPINFTQNGSGSYSDGRLYFTYTWQSSSGNLMDLAGCQVYEAVTYPGPPGTYVWPKPPWNQSQPNPSVGPTPKIPGSNGTGGDTNYPGTFSTPYGTNQFDATQVYEYGCGWTSGDLATGITIHREVDQNGSYYTYKVTKSQASASCTLGVNCYQ